MVSTRSTPTACSILAATLARLYVLTGKTAYRERAEALLRGGDTEATFQSCKDAAALPGVLAGAILAFAKSLGEFGATITFVSNIPGETQTISAAIYSLTQVPGGDAAAFRLVIVAVVISLAALIAAITLSMVSSVNVGVVSLAFAWIVGVYLGGMPVAKVIAAFPVDLLLNLVGITLLFGMANLNGTLGRMAARAVRACRGSAGVIPIMFFFISVTLATRAASLRKSLWRAGSTLVGVTVAMVLVANFAQATLAFDLALALWMGLLTAASSVESGQRAYGFASMGFTVPINLARWVGDQLATTGRVTRAVSQLMKA